MRWCCRLRMAWEVAAVRVNPEQQSQKAKPVTTVLGFALLALGLFLLTPLLYRYQSIDWNRFFTYFFIILGVLFAILGLLAISRSVQNKKQQDQTSLTQATKETGASRDLKPSKLHVYPTVDYGQHGYYIFAKIVGLSPVLPLLISMGASIVISVSCSALFGGMSGTTCMRPNWDQRNFLETLAYAGGLGWLLSLPAWGLLILTGKILGIPSRSQK